MTKNKNAPPPTLARGTPASIPIERLELDQTNPRLGANEAAATQVEILQTLWKQMAVDEVALSIAANGYFPQEPLLVIPKIAGRKDPLRDEFTVVEGNRRLAAVTLLCDEALREQVGATDLPPLSAEARAKLQELPALIFDERKQLWQQLGFRHINGPQRWDSYSKAKYIELVHEKYNIPLPEIARRIGDTHDTVARIYRGLKLLQQGEQQAGFDKEDRKKARFAFSHLYTAASDGVFQRFLGIDAEKSLRPNPVKVARINHLRELLFWLYGQQSKGIDPIVVTQNPDLWKLQAVIAKASSLAALRSNIPLARAHEISLGDEARFRTAIARALEELKQASATVLKGYSGQEDLREAADDLVANANHLRSQMGKLDESRPKRK